MKNQNNFFPIMLVFFISFITLSFQLLFIRIMAVYEWQNYASMVISLAFLGYALSGTILYLLKEQLKQNPEKLTFITCIFFYLFIMTSFILYKLIPLNPFEIGWSPIQYLYFFLHFLILLLPFTSSAFIIGAKFILIKNVSLVYFSNLLGSSLGTLSSLFLLNLIHPYKAFTVLLFITMMILLFYHYQNKNRFNIQTFSIIFIIILFSPLLFITFVNKCNLLNYSMYKDISYSLKLPNAKIIKQKASSMGVLEVIKADGLRNVSGLSYNFTGTIPIQKALFFDGGNPSPIIPYKNNKDIEYLKYLTSSFPYYLSIPNNNSTLIVGLGGGEGVLRSKAFDTKEITVVEVDKNVIQIFNEEYSPNNNNKLNNVTIKHDDIRSFSRKTSKKFDIIDITLSDSFNSASSGIKSLSENYLYTKESFKEFYNILSEKGILSVTGWIKSPPRDNIKLFNLSINILKELNIPNYKEKIAFVRSSNTATLCISKKQINSDSIRDFCKKMSFDSIYFHKIKQTDVNKYFIFKNPIFYETCQNIITPSTNDYIKNYDFNISSPTDNKPYFYNFIKAKSLKIILKSNTKIIPFTEWGILVIIILLILITIVSSILIFIPLLLSEYLKTSKMKVTNTAINYKVLTIIFFFLSGIVFFTVEIPLIQKMIMFLSHPTYSLSISIFSLLLFSGLGSFISNKLKEKTKIFIFVCLVFILLTYSLFLNKIIDLLIYLPFILKIILAILIIAIPAFFMGIPFPSALLIVKQKDIEFTPWLWGINGFASVLSVLLVTALSMYFGFNFVFLSAAIIYLVEMFFYTKL